MKTVLRRLGLYLNTLRWLRVSQLGWQVYRRIRPVKTPAPVSVEPTRDNLLSKQGARSPQPDEFEFRFLNQSKPVDPDALDWHPGDMPRLWRYNLHYFDYLHWDSFPADAKRRLIDSWIENNPVGTIDAWEPYTLSLRIVNWVKYFDELAEPVPLHWQESLLYQGLWLESNLEFHVLANHLFKNAKALIFAGRMFSGVTGTRLLEKGFDIFSREAREQFLPDGGHFERSPMYHSIALEDLLDVCNVLDVEEQFQLRMHDKFAETATRALAFLRDIAGADNRIPLFNDSAYGIAPEPDELLAFGERLLGVRLQRQLPRLAMIQLSSSGYYGYRDSADSLLIDCGDIGPDYQPGHAHCDTLSFVLCIDGQPVVIDSGVSGYEADPNRDYVRSTRAHNTVEVNGEEQSEIWGVFRVARRARARRQLFEQSASGSILFAGTHDGYERLAERVSHERRVEAEPGLSWRIADSLSGRGRVSLASYLHFHPDIVPVPLADGVWELQRASRAVAMLSIDGDVESTVESAAYCPEFGRSREHKVVVLRQSGNLPMSSGYKIDKIQ